jgi:hypothetical protein
LPRNSLELQSILEVIEDTKLLASLSVNKYSETNFLLNNYCARRTKYPTEKLCRLVGVSRQYRSDPAKMRRRGTMKLRDAGRRSVMRHKQNTFMAGVAALALFAASGAFAQQGQAEQKGSARTGGAMQSTQAAKSPGGMSQGGMNQGGMKQGGTKQGGASGQNAQSERQPSAPRAGGMANGGQSAQQRGERGQTNAQINAQSRTTQSRTTESRNGAENGRYAAQPENRNRRGGATAQRNDSLKGLQGNTKVPMQGAQGARGAGGNVALNEQQRTRIRDTIINGRGAPRVGSVDFDVNVGTLVPRGHLHLVRVPETLVRIDPGWRGFLYFVYNDEVVIVDPHDMRIVEVLPV